MYSGRIFQLEWGLLLLAVDCFKLMLFHWKGMLRPFGICCGGNGDEKKRSASKRMSRPFHTSKERSECLKTAMFVFHSLYGIIVLLSGSFYRHLQFRL